MWPCTDLTLPVCHTKWLYGLALQMACLLANSGRQGNHLPQNHTRTHTHTHFAKHKPCLLCLITHSWVYFGLQHRGNARCLLDREGKIVVSTPLPRQVCFPQPLIKLSFLSAHNMTALRRYLPLELSLC